MTRLAGYAIGLLYVAGFFGLMVVPLIDPDNMAGVTSLYLFTQG